MAFHWEILSRYILGLPCFGSGGGIGTDSVRRFQKLPICPMGPISARNKTDPQLAKAELFHCGGGGREIGNEFEPRKKGSTEQDFLRFIFHSHDIVLICLFIN